VAESIIEFEKVVAGYSPSVTILNELTLDARKGEITLLIGPNGAGKSTVLKTLFGMLVPRSGEVRFEGKRINGKSQRHWEKFIRKCLIIPHFMSRISISPITPLSIALRAVLPTERCILSWPRTISNGYR
jgi:ABC-type multidrug transport system ATPase subunit